MNNPLLVEIFLWHYDSLKRFSDIIEIDLLSRLKCSTILS